MEELAKRLQAMEARQQELAQDFQRQRGQAAEQGPQAAQAELAQLRAAPAAAPQQQPPLERLGGATVDARTLGKPASFSGRREAWRGFCFVFHAFACAAHANVAELFKRAEAMGARVVDGRDLDEAAAALQPPAYALAMTTTDDTHILLHSVEEGDGAEAWRRLCWEYEPDKRARHAAVFHALLRREFGEDPNGDLANVIESFERGVRRCEGQSGKALDPDVKISTLVGGMQNVKGKECHYCGKLSHIKQDCRKPNADIKAGKVDASGQPPPGAAVGDPLTIHVIQPAGAVAAVGPGGVELALLGSGVVARPVDHAPDVPALLPRRDLRPMASATSEPIINYSAKNTTYVLDNGEELAIAWNAANVDCLAPSASALRRGGATVVVAPERETLRAASGGCGDLAIHPDVPWSRFRRGDRGIRAARAPAAIEEAELRRSAKVPIGFSDHEKEEHYLTCIPSRSRRCCCARAAAPGDPRRRARAPAAVLLKPTVMMDYTFVTDPPSDMMTISNACDQELGMALPLVHGKGPVEIAMHLGHWSRKVIILRVDGEPANKALTEAIRIGRADPSVLEMKPQHSPKPVGAVENMSNEVKNLLRTAVMHRRDEAKVELHTGHPPVPRFTQHCGWCTRARAARADGRAACERLKGWPCNGKIAFFGKCLWHQTPDASHLSPLDERWSARVWSGTSWKTDERIIALGSEVRLARSVRRKAQGRRWGTEMRNEVPCTPRLPRLGAQTPAARPIARACLAYLDRSRSPRQADFVPKPHRAPPRMPEPPPKSRWQPLAEAEIEAASIAAKREREDLSFQEKVELFESGAALAAYAATPDIGARDVKDHKTGEDCETTAQSRCVAMELNMHDRDTRAATPPLKFIKLIVPRVASIRRPGTNDWIRVLGFYDIAAAFWRAGLLLGEPIAAIPPRGEEAPGMALQMLKVFEQCGYQVLKTSPQIFYARQCDSLAGLWGDDIMAGAGNEGVDHLDTMISGLCNIKGSPCSKQIGRDDPATLDELDGEAQTKYAATPAELRGIVDGVARGIMAQGFFRAIADLRGTRAAWSVTVGSDATAAIDISARTGVQDACETNVADPETTASGPRKHQELMS
ncbi:unnamed protein product [Prorocentrum cordatum]|uniref:CCHC-type domain-containing protein n=1 Tax=Prorocentrum cordatum TaxID=2364126 RepID=A0ABN9Y3B1_9DINO|nr:unnamed protein product [Polarella glacialis]